MIGAATHEHTHRLTARLPLVKAFLDSTVTYILSREWQDLLSIYLFRLHPLPHCVQNSVCYSFFGLVSRPVDAGPGCSAEAETSTQLFFTLGLLLTASMTR